jgi:hypothetical protein
MEVNQMEVYNVVWGSGASIMEENGVNTFAGVHGTYKTEASAKRALEECKQSFLDEILENPDYDEEDKASFRHNVQIYGSVEEGYFEIDYAITDSPVEIYIQITHTHVQD